MDGDGISLAFCIYSGNTNEQKTPKPLERQSERTRQNDYKRFITRIPVTNDGEMAGKTVYGLNEDKIRDEERHDDFYTVATNLDDPAEEIIKINQIVTI